MATEGGPNIVADGLVLHLDAANNKSYASQNLEVDVLLVGGGGSGGTGDDSGGGGAGGLLFKPNYIIEQQQYTVTVGNGGQVSSSSRGESSNGGDTEISGSSTGLELRAIGGGGGESYNSNPPASDGGSGGGTAANKDNAGSALQPSSQWGGFGNNGGNNRSTNSNDGSGGGGAGQTGGTPGQYDGGDGLKEVTINGTTYNFSNIFTSNFGEDADGDGNSWFAGGGMGGGEDASTTNHQPGKGGGADSFNKEAVPNTGGGGAAFDDNIANTSVNDGASGIVLIRYKGPQKATGGTITHFNGYTIHAFTSSGIFSVGDFIGDISGNNNSGQLINEPTFVSNNLGSLVFDGTNDYLSIDNSNLNNLTEGSFEFWFNSSSTGPLVGFFTDINNYFTIWTGNSTGFWNDESIRVIYRKDGTYYYNYAAREGNSYYADSNWHHCVFTVDSNGNNLYTDGTLLTVEQWSLSTEGNSSTRWLSDLSPSIIALGRRLDNYTTVEISSTKIYNRSLSISEVLQNYNATKSRFGL